MRAQFRSNRAECRFAAKCWIDKYSRTAESNSLGLQARAGLKGKYWLFVQLTYFSFPKISTDMQWYTNKFCLSISGKRMQPRGKSFLGKIMQEGWKGRKIVRLRDSPFCAQEEKKIPTSPFPADTQERRGRGRRPHPRKTISTPFPIFSRLFFFGSDFPGNWPSVPFPFSPLLPLPFLYFPG